MQTNPKTPLNHLHAAADAQHRQPAPLCPIEQRKFHGVTFRGIAPARRKIIPASQHQSANVCPCAQLQRYFEYIRNANGVSPHAARNRGQAWSRQSRRSPYSGTVDTRWVMATSFIQLSANLRPADAATCLTARKTAACILNRSEG